MKPDQQRHPLHLGVIGLGRGFMLTLPGLRDNPAVRLVAAADPRSEARSAFVEEFAARAYVSAEELLADEAVEAVYIASPHGFHAAQSIAASNARKHVLVEKPMATSIADSLAMVEAAERAGRVLIVGPSHGFDAPVQQAARLIQSGEYGAVRMITALNYTDFLYRPRRPEELDTSRGGGVVYSQATHQIDVVRRLAGSRVRTVRAMTGAWDAARPSEGAYSAFFTFDNGAAATLTYSGYAHYDSDELMDWVSELGQPKDPGGYGTARRQLTSTHGDEAAAKVSRTYGNERLPQAAAPHHEHFGFVLVSCEGADLRMTPSGTWLYSNGERAFLPLPAPRFARAEVIDEFIAAVCGTDAAKHDGTWGAATLTCCDALLRSSREQREVTIA